MDGGGNFGLYGEICEKLYGGVDMYGCIIFISLFYIFIINKKKYLILSDFGPESNSLGSCFFGGVLNIFSQIILLVEAKTLPLE